MVIWNGCKLDLECVAKKGIRFIASYFGRDLKALSFSTQKITFSFFQLHETVSEICMTLMKEKFARHILERDF